MTPSKKIRELYAEGYQLTPEAFEYLNNLPEIERVINKILTSNVNKAILSVEDIDEFLIEDTIKKDDITEQSIPEKEETITEEQETQQIEEEKEVLEEEVKTEVKIETKLRKEKVQRDGHPAIFDVVDGPGAAIPGGDLAGVFADDPGAPEVVHAHQRSLDVR